jgi:hypothetical protein
MSTTTLEWKHAEHVMKTIGQLELNPQQLTLLLQCMSPVTEAIKDGRIQTLQDLSKLLQKKSEERFGPLHFVTPVAKGDTLVGNEFITHSRRLAGEGGKQTLGREAYYFYKKQENQHLLPTDLAVKTIIFCDDEFSSGSDRYVHSLYRNGSHWFTCDSLLSGEFDGDCVAAVA